jgi:4-hydroxy-3-methylbut-2-en-1-yl diphosphate synthase IspG/GcpE
MLSYTYDDHVIEISESANGQDVDFRIRVFGDGSLDQKIKDVQHDFEKNAILTDALFYAYLNHEYQFIVRQDFYSEFILSLMKHRLLLSVEWKKD